jgi:Schlafen, AlbA_2
MFDPENWEAILKLKAVDLVSLPSLEDDRHEYKASATKDNDLAEKIARAASGFWNSGGGLFVAGVDNNGKPDGGITLTVGRQSRRDWIDQMISRVSPRAQYAVHYIEDEGAGLTITSGSAVVLIGFALSEHGPHMGPDNRYYIRAGAHTVPAPHFLVEAIYARRGLRAPMLRHVIRRKPEGGGVLQLGIICLNDAPALDVELTLEPLPVDLKSWGAQLPLTIPVISRQASFYFDFHQLSMAEPTPTFQARLKYTDLANRTYQVALDVDVDKQMGPNLGGGSDLVERAIKQVADAIKQLRAGRI